MHPQHPELVAYVESVRGCRFLEFSAQPVPVPALPAYVPQLLARRSYRGHLDGPVYAVRPNAIGKRIKTADEVRNLVGLAPKQLLVALLFDQDDRIEDLYDSLRLRQLAEAGYDLIVAPSYSVWWPRPRIHHLYNLTRSLAVTVALQELGAPTIPRVDWVADADVEHWADWISANPAVEMVAIDAMASDETSWNQLLEGLEYFDRLTERRLRYLINGPSVAERWDSLYRLLDPERLSITDSNLTTSPPTADEQLVFPGSSERWRGPRLGRRVKQREADLAAARHRRAA